MNYKRKRPKHQRAGCIMCKPHKDERCTKRAKISDERRMLVTKNDDMCNDRRLA